MPGTRAARALGKNTLDPIDSDQESLLLKAHDGHPGRIEAFTAKAGRDLSSSRHDIIQHFRDYTGKHSAQPMNGMNAGMRLPYRPMLEV